MRWSEDDYYAWQQKNKNKANKPLPAQSKRRNKYRAKKTWMDGICFDSQTEANFYRQLKLLHRAGALDGYIVHGAMVCTEGTDKDNRATLYEPDFILLYPDGTYRIIDTKSQATITPTFKLKMKALREKFPKITIDVEK